MPNVRVMTIGPKPSIISQAFCGDFQKCQTRRTNTIERRPSAVSKMAVPIAFAAIATRPVVMASEVSSSIGRALLERAYATVGRSELKAHQACGAKMAAQTATAQ